MKAHAGGSFAARKAGAKSIKHKTLIAVGPNAEWSLDGFDKLLSAGFAIYGIRDKWSRFWLSYTVLPSNRYADVISVVYLYCIWKYGGKVIILIVLTIPDILFTSSLGIPVQTTSDRGSETRDAYSFQCSLR